MEKKDSLFIRYMKYWYGIYGPLDEYKKSQMERIGNNAFFITFIPFDIIVGISIVILSLTGKKGLAYYFLLIGWLILWFITNRYIIHQCKKLELQVYEVEKDQVSKIKKRIWLTSILTGLCFGILLTIIFIAINNNPIGISALCYFLVFTIGFVLIDGFNRTKRIKVAKDND